LAQRGIKIDRDNGCALNNKGDPMKVTVATTNLDDMIYASEFFVGNPPQRMTGVFDTGSTNLWVLGNHTKLSGDPEKKASYDQAASSTAKKTNQSAEIFFGSGSLKGNFVYDDFRLGGCDKESGGLLHIKKQKFGVADEATTIFDGTNFEAIVGLAYPELAEDGVTPVFDRLIQQKSLQSNVFAFFMSYEKEEDKKPHYKPELTLGYYDLAKIKGTIDWHPVLLKYMFGVKLDDIKVNGKPLNVCSRLMKPDACMLTIDSGSTTGMVPIAAIPAFTENLVPIANTMAECNGVQDIGSITWVINGHDYTLNADEWLMEQEIDFA
jgi:cathepsin D